MRRVASVVGAMVTLAAIAGCSGEPSVRVAEPAVATPPDTSTSAPTSSDVECSNPAAGSAIDVELDGIRPLYDEGLWEASWQLLGGRSTDEYLVEVLDRCALLPGFVLPGAAVVEVEQELHPPWSTADDSDDPDELRYVTSYTMLAEAPGSTVDEAALLAIDQFATLLEDLTGERVDRSAYQDESSGPQPYISVGRGEEPEYRVFVRAEPHWVEASVGPVLAITITRSAPGALLEPPPADTLDLLPAELVESVGELPFGTPAPGAEVQRRVTVDPFDATVRDWWSVDMLHPGTEAETAALQRAGTAALLSAGYEEETFDDFATYSAPDSADGTVFVRLADDGAGLEVDLTGVQVPVAPALGEPPAQPGADEERGVPTTSLLPPTTAPSISVPQVRSGVLLLTIPGIEPATDDRAVMASSALTNGLDTVGYVTETQAYFGADEAIVVPGAPVISDEVRVGGPGLDREPLVADELATDYTMALLAPGMSEDEALDTVQTAVAELLRTAYPDQIVSEGGYTDEVVGDARSVSVGTSYPPSTNVWVGRSDVAGDFAQAPRLNLTVQRVVTDPAPDQLPSREDFVDPVLAEQLAILDELSVQGELDTLRRGRYPRGDDPSAAVYVVRSAEVEYDLEGTNYDAFVEEVRAGAVAAGYRDDVGAGLSVFTYPDGRDIYMYPLGDGALVSLNGPR